MRAVPALQDTGQSNVLGTVLLFGIVISVSVGVVLAGSTVMQTSKSTTSLEGATLSMGEIDDAVSSLGTAGESEQSVSLANFDGEGSLRIEDEGTMTIAVDDGGSTWTESRTLGRIVYELDGQRVAYQSGGIWRGSAEGNNSAVVSPPNFEYRYRGGDPTLTLPIVQVSGDADGGDVTVRQAGDSERLFPASASQAGALSDGAEIEVTVDSEFYKAWGEVFESRTNGTVTYDHGARSVTLVLQGPESVGGQGPVRGPLTTNEVPLLNSYNYVTLDSYDSRTSQPYARGSAGTVYVDGDYGGTNHVDVAGDLVVDGHANFEGPDGTADFQRIEGVTVVGGTTADSSPTLVKNELWFEDDFHTQDDLEVTGSVSDKTRFEGDLYVGGNLTDLVQTEVDGNVYVQGDVTASGASSTVKGDVVAGGTVNNAFKAIVDGSVDENADPPEPDQPSTPELGSVEPIVDEKRQAIAADNDNDTVANMNDIQDPSVTACPVECRLDAGDYYFPNGLELQQETLVLDTTDGPIEIFAERDASNVGVELIDANVTVYGDEPVKLYTDGHFQIYEHNGTSPQAEIVTRPKPKRAPLFTAYVHPDREIEFANDDPTVTGLINGSGGANGASIVYTSHATIYGAIIGEATDVNSHGKIHYDEALASPIGAGGNDDGSRVMYLRASSRSIRITD